MSWHIEVASQSAFAAVVEKECAQSYQHEDAKKILSQQNSLVQSIIVPEDKILHISSSGHIDDQNITINSTIRTIQK